MQVEESFQLERPLHELLKRLHQQADGSFSEMSGWTDIFIYPGYEFKAIDGMITNFHLPKSTLIMLVSALAGRESVLHAYETLFKKDIVFLALAMRCSLFREYLRTV